MNIGKTVTKLLKDFPYANHVGGHNFISCKEFIDQETKFVCVFSEDSVICGISDDNECTTLKQYIDVEENCEGSEYAGRSFSYNPTYFNVVLEVNGSMVCITEYAKEKLNVETIRTMLSCYKKYNYIVSDRKLDYEEI